MSTHAAIIERTITGFRGIYCHFDGDSIGKILQTYYNEPAKVTELINLGNISSLGRFPAPTGTVGHSFADPESGVTVAYHRDRGEQTGWEPAVSPTLGGVLEDIDYEYYYVFDKGTWTKGR